MSKFEILNSFNDLLGQEILSAHLLRSGSLILLFKSKDLVKFQSVTNPDQSEEISICKPTSQDLYDVGLFSAPELQEALEKEKADSLLEEESRSRRIYEALKKRFEKK